ncbi:hypothetical protein D3C81_2248640 [compost metagenome]
MPARLGEQVLLQAAQPPQFVDDLAINRAARLAPKRGAAQELRNAHAGIKRLVADGVRFLWQTAHFQIDNALPVFT